MSGHSHWQNIKHKKQAQDKQKSKLFSKFSRLISVAAREGGGDPEHNFELRDAIERAKDVDMPGETIERAVKRGTGELEGVEYKDMTLEAYGPGGTAIIIDAITDNRNRTISEMKQLLRENHAKMAEPGSVKYLFERKGVVTVDKSRQREPFCDKENLELASIEAGAEDVEWSNDFLDIYIPVDELSNVKGELEKRGVKIESASPGWKAKNEIEVSEKEKEKLEKLFQVLSENDDTQEVYSNLSSFSS